jgi:CRP-like cAMP-binding protein
MAAMEYREFGDGWPTVATAGLTAVRLEGQQNVDAFLAWIERHGDLCRVPANTRLFGQGTACEQVFFVDDGWVRLLRTEGTGADIILGFRRRGALLGADAIASRMPHAMSAVTRTAATLRVVASDLLQEAVQQDEDVRQAFVQWLGMEAVRHIERCGALGCFDARGHLEHLLIDALAYSRGTPPRVPLSASELAGLIGIDVSHVWRLLRVLKQEGAIDLARGWVIVPDHSRLLEKIAS